MTTIRTRLAALLGALLLAVALSGPVPDGSHWQAPPAPTPTTTGQVVA